MKKWFWKSYIGAPVYSHKEGAPPSIFRTLSLYILIFLLHSMLSPCSLYLLLLLSPLESLPRLLITARTKNDFSYPTRRVGRVGH